MEENKIKVYVKVSNNNIVTQIDSNIFLTDLIGWQQIDEGVGDKYYHAQGNYLEKGLVDNQGKYNYKIVDGKVVELTEQEKATLFPPVVPQPTREELLQQQLLETQALVAELRYKTILKENGGM